LTAPAISIPSDITPDGSIVVGGLGGPVFRWDLNTDTFENIGGLGSGAISDDGTKIVTRIQDTDGIVKAAIYHNGLWTPLPPVPGSTPCSQDGTTTATLGLDISGDGSTV